MIVYASIGPFVLAYMHFLAESAVDAVAQLQIAELIPETRNEEIVYRLSTAPRRSTLWASLAGFLLFLLLFLLKVPALDLITADTIASTRYLRLLEGAFFWILAGAALSFIVHQLKTINDINTKYLPITLHHLEPLYKLSSIPIQTAIGQTLIPVTIFLLFPTLLDDPSSLLFSIIGFLFSMLIIYAPIRSVHKLLENDKLSKQTKNAKNLDQTLVRLHEALAEEKTDEYDALEQAISMLYKERDELRQSSTWPWKPGALRSTIATLTLPMILWFLQNFLDNFL
jgi:hypothetical protein